MTAAAPIDRAFWGIHAKGAMLPTILLKRNQLAIGWADVGDLSSSGKSRERLRALLTPVTPPDRAGSIPQIAGQLYRFVSELKNGDIVAYRDTSIPTVHLGEVIGDYIYDPADDPEHPNRRPIKWVRQVPVTDVSPGALSELGSLLTFFALRNFAEEWAIHLAGAKVTVGDDYSVQAKIGEASEQNTRDFVRKAIATHLKGHPLALLVADLLRTMGYRTRVSPPGADGGTDILAHRDELGFEPPIVRVQVKSSEGSVPGPDVAQLIGNLGRGEHGLFVTMGTYSSQARDKVLKSEVRLIDGETLIEMLLDHYEALSPRYKAVIPLKRIYVPQSVDVDSS